LWLQVKKKGIQSIAGIELCGEEVPKTAEINEDLLDKKLTPNAVFSLFFEFDLYVAS